MTQGLRGENRLGLERRRFLSKFELPPGDAWSSRDDRFQSTALFALFAGRRSKVAVVGGPSLCACTPPKSLSSLGISLTR
jgi:hypothetical protein